MKRRNSHKPTKAILPILDMPDLTEYYNISPQEAVFVAEYIQDWDEIVALENSGLAPTRKTALKVQRQIAYDLIKKPAIQAAIQQAVQYRVEKTLLSKDKIIAHLFRIATSDIAQAYDGNGHLKDIKDIPYHLRCCISKIKSRTKYRRTACGEYEFDGYITELEVESHTAALKELAKLIIPQQPAIQFNQYNQQNNIQHNIDLSHLDAEKTTKVLELLSGEETPDYIKELEKIEECNLEN